MKKVKQLNGLTIKEKRLDEIPSFCKDSWVYAVFDKNGTWLEDNLTYDEAIQFCKTYKKQSLRYANSVELR